MVSNLQTTKSIIVSSEYETVRDFITGVKKSRIPFKNIAVLISFSKYQN